MLTDRGPKNSLTDVAGVRVGHVTLISGDGPLVPGKGPVRTGVTVILLTDYILDALDRTALGVAWARWRAAAAGSGGPLDVDALVGPRVPRAKA